MGVYRLPLLDETLFKGFSPHPLLILPVPGRSRFEFGTSPRLRPGRAALQVQVTEA